MFSIFGIAGASRRSLSAALVTLLAVSSAVTVPVVAAADPPTVTITQAAVSIGPTNLETVAVTGHFAGFTAPYHFVFAVRGTAVLSGDDSVADLTRNLTDNCSITTQSVSVTITDAAGLSGTASAILDRSLCPPPPAVDHAADRVMAGPTLTKTSFIDRLRAVGSPAYPFGSAIYDELAQTGVNPAFALGLYHAESSSGTRGYAVTTLNWGNMLYHSWQDVYGAVPYAPGNGYTYAKFPSWLAGVRAFAHLVGVYDGAGYVTVSEASAHWLGTHEGSARHLTYLRNITNVMTLLPDDAVPKMTALVAPTHARGTFVASWNATDNLGVTGYQLRMKRGSEPWILDTATGRSKALTLASGTWIVAVRALDAAGNASAWRQVIVAVDANAPVVTSLVAPAIVRSADGSFVATFSATDNVGVYRYYIRTKREATGAWSAVRTQTGRSMTFSNLHAGTWYISVSARDAVGNIAPWREVAVVVPRDDRSFLFSSGTVHGSNAADFRGTDSSTSRAGATMTAHFTGDRFYLIGTAGPTKGKLRVAIDGVSFTIDEGRYAGHPATSNHHRVLLVSKWLSAGRHTVVITALGTTHRPTITIDAVGWRT